MGPFALWSQDGDWVESNISFSIESSLDEITSRSLANATTHHAAQLYESHTPPSYAYVGADSVDPLLAQPQSESGELPSASALYTGEMIPSPRCRLNCGCDWEDDHHLFVQCAGTQRFRVAAVRSLESELVAFIGDIAPSDRFSLRYLIHHLFDDNELCWPLGRSSYYIGHTPPLHHFLPQDKNSKRDIELLNSALHTASIRLAGRIWEEVYRVSKTNK
jgi:hypothetical protein